MLSLIALAFGTAIVSGIAGNGLFPRFVTQTIHAIMCIAALWAQGVDWFLAPLGILPCVMWWVLFRSGRIAKAEITAMANPSTENMLDVIAAYFLPATASAIIGLLLAIAGQNFPMICLAFTFYALPFIATLALSAANYRTAFGNWLGWPTTVDNKLIEPFFDCRRFTELTTGLAGGAVIATLIHGIAGAL